MQKCTHSVDFEKCCETYSWFQNRLRYSRERALQKLWQILLDLLGIAEQWREVPAADAPGAAAAPGVGPGGYPAASPKAKPQA